MTEVVLRGILHGIKAHKSFRHVDTGKCTQPPSLLLEYHKTSLESLELDGKWDGLSVIPQLREFQVLRRLSLNHKHFIKTAPEDIRPIGMSSTWNDPKL